MEKKLQKINHKHDIAYSTIIWAIRNARKIAKSNVHFERKGTGTYLGGTVGALAYIFELTYFSKRSRLEEKCESLGVVTVSTNYVSCPRPILRKLCSPH